MSNTKPPAPSKGRGRPKLNVTPTLVRLPEGVPERIDAVVGTANRRAEFIREATIAELERREAAAPDSATSSADPSDRPR